jgi:hypothetical protein
MTHPINDHNDFLEDLIEAEYQLTQNPDCLNGDHSWQPAGDLDTETIRCARCKWAPHVPARPTDTRTTTQED